MGSKPLGVDAEIACAAGVKLLRGADGGLGICRQGVEHVFVGGCGSRKALALGDGFALADGDKLHPKDDLPG